MMKWNIFYHYEVYDSNVKKCSISTWDFRLISVTAFYETEKKRLELYDQVEVYEEYIEST